MVFNKLNWLLSCSLVWLILGADEFGAWVELSAGLSEHSTCLLQVGTKPVCTASWGQFGIDALTSTQFIHSEAVPLDFTNFHGTGSTTSGLFVFPKQQFAVCVITKVGSTQWNNILLQMAAYDMSGFEEVEGDIRQTVEMEKRDFEAIGGNLRGTLAEKTQVFSNQSATRAVFVRDPIARFASAFLMMCASVPLEHSANSQCPMRTNVNDTVTTMKAAVEWASKTDMLSASDHWKPQSSECELKSRIGEYNIIGLYSKEHFTEDIACVLETAGLSQYNAAWNTPETEYHDPRNFFSSGTTAEENALLQRIFTREAANSLLTIYKDDYILFNIPRPDWIAGATGELYDVDISYLQPEASWYRDHGPAA